MGFIFLYSWLEDKEDYVAQASVKSSLFINTWLLCNLCQSDKKCTLYFLN